MLTLSQAILTTIIYSDHFDYPLTFSELHQRLIAYHLNRSQLKSQLKLLIQQKKLVLTGKYYHLPNKSNLIKLRQQRYLNSQKNLNLAKKYLHYLHHIPCLVAIYLTGSLANFNSKPNDDIDLMIITKPHCLWLTRLVLTLYTQFLGLRRTPKSFKPNQLCLNLYLSANTLFIPYSKRSLYSAYELIQLKPLYDPHNLYSQLFHHNRWITSYLPNFTLPHPSTVKTKSSLITLFLLPLNFLAYKIQQFYMSKRLTREYISLTSAFFHPRDPFTKLRHHLIWFNPQDFSNF